MKRLIVACLVALTSTGALAVTKKTSVNVNNTPVVTMADGTSDNMMLQGEKWDLTISPANTLTYSFPPSGTFESSSFVGVTCPAYDSALDPGGSAGAHPCGKTVVQLTADEQTVATQIITDLGKIVPITFTLIDETTQGPADIRIAKFSTGISGAVTGFPSYGQAAGDVTIQNGAYPLGTGSDNGTVFGWMLRHEIGHALGLKHPFNSGRAGLFGLFFNGPPDIWWNDHMGYRYLAGNGFCTNCVAPYVSETYGYPQNYSWMDYVALQDSRMYGAGSGNSGAHTYSWDSNGAFTFDGSIVYTVPGANRIYQSFIVPATGNNILDLTTGSNTCVSLDMGAGQPSTLSTTQKAIANTTGSVRVDGNFWTPNGGSIFSDLKLPAGGCTVTGSSRAETFWSGSGNDTVNGVSGADTMKYDGINRSALTGSGISGNNGTISGHGVDPLTNIQKINTADQGDRSLQNFQTFVVRLGN